MKYLEIENEIINKIKEGVYKPHDKLPPESEMLRKYDVSKMTIRKSMDSLLSKSLVYSIKGSGVYVSPFYEFNKIKNYFDSKGYKNKKFISTSSLPQKIIDTIGKENYKEGEWVPFVTFFYKDKEVVAYSLNWISKMKKDITVENIGGDMFDKHIDMANMLTTKQALEVKITKSTTKDRQILINNGEYTARKVIINYDISNKPILITHFSCVMSMIEEKVIKTSK